MKRRTLLKTALSAMAASALAKLSLAQQPVFAPAQLDTLYAIGDAVLPASLGQTGRHKAVDDFVAWHTSYKVGVQMTFGYGATLRDRKTAPAPAQKYPALFDQLDSLSKEKGGTFVSLSQTDRVAVLEATMTQAKVEHLSGQPNGANLAADLLSHFYSSSDGNDVLLNAEVHRSACRGQKNAPQKPAELAKG